MPHNLLKPAVFLAGLATLCWIGAGYLGASALALSVVLLIGACYVAGGLELHRYRQATAALARAAAAASTRVPDLAAWLEPLPAPLRHAVRQRVEGERVALPAPALTPYLVGLLVLLGMLGTLLGMMTTLRGTGLALESATDLDAIRTSLAAPVSGLAFAFGTSIAGVAASAMLGLLSALCRRERAAAVQALDAAIATTLRTYSRVHQREEAFRLLQRQVDAMPALVMQLQATMAAIEQQSLAAHERQLAQQHAFHDRAEAVHARLAASVEQSLKSSVAEGARAASAALQPVAESTMAALAQSAAALHDDVAQAMRQQLDALSGRLHEGTATVAALWTDALEQQRRADDTRLQDLHASLDRFATTFEQRSEHLVDAVATRFETTATSLVDTVRHSHAQLQATLEAQTQAQARDTLDAIARLVHDAAEAPKAAAAVIAELRGNLSESLARDTAMLEERGRLLATVETLLGAVNHAAAEQRTAVDALISTSADALERVATRFTEHVQAETGRLDAAADRIAAGAIEVASLGDVFGAAVQRFGEANEQLVARLHAIEGALDQSLARSDEQLAYYVAQAREVVDLSVLAQKQIIGELQQLAHARAAEPA